MKIYVLGAVGSADANIEEIFGVYKKALSKKHEVLGTPIETSKFQGTDEERFVRAENFVKTCDAVVADMSAVSTGAGIELGMAHLLGKKIFVLAKEGSKVSALIKGMPHEMVEFYHDFVDLYSKLEKI